MRGIFITGTSTGVGKTVVAAGLAWALRKKKISVGIMKPFASADRVFSNKYKSQDTAILAKAAGAKEPDSELNPFFYSLPASPFMAAEITKKPKASTERAVQILKKLADRHDFVIVEGIGGIMVPLTEKEYLADFVRLAELPVAIVSLPSLGTLNHTILTVRACREFGLYIKGIIINMMPRRPSIVEQKTPEIIERLSGIPVLEILPLLRNIDYRTVGRLVEKAAANLADC